jgi:Flp pilus assembly protein TadD
VSTLDNLGRLNYAQGRPEEARLLWEQVLEVAPRRVAMLNNLGWLHDDQGRPEEARLLWDLL